jgi:hypothetical protein
VVLSETNVDDIIDGIISNKYKYHETLDFEESITTFKSLKTFFDWPKNLVLAKAVNLKLQNRNKMACFPVQTLLHKATSMDGVNSINNMQIWNIERT